MVVRARIYEQGQVVIPENLLSEAGIKPNSTVLIVIESGCLTVRSFRAMFAKVRTNLRNRVQGDGIVDELLRDRRTGRS